MNKSPAPPYVNVTDLTRHLEWHDLDCRKTSRELTSLLSEELGGIVSLRNLVLACLFAGYAVVPSRGPSHYLTFCKVNP